MDWLLKLDAARNVRARRLVPRQPYHVGLDFHGVTAVLATNSQYLVGHIRLGYAYFESSPAESPDVTLLAIEAGEEGFEETSRALLPNRTTPENVVISMESELIFLLRDRPTTAYYTTMNLFGGVVIRLRRRYTCLHAATVSYQNCAAILCGAARCGKTSLTVEMVSRGLDYSSDDVTLVDRDALVVAAFPRASTCGKSIKKSRQTYWPVLDALQDSRLPTRNGSWSTWGGGYLCRWHQTSSASLATKPTIRPTYDRWKRQRHLRD